MRAYVVLACVAVGLCLLFASAFAEPAQVNPEDLDNVYKALRGVSATEPLRELQSKEGFLRYVGAPPGAFFVTGATGSKSASAETSARSFLSEHAAAFSVASPRISLEKMREKSDGNRRFVRLSQHYNGLSVFGAEIVVQADPLGGVVSVLSDIMRDTTSLDSGDLSLSPGLDSDAARAAAVAWAVKEHKASAENFTAGDPQRMILDPVVVGREGAVVLVWALAVVTATDTVAPSADMVFVEAQSGAVVFTYPLLHDSKYREIYDALNSTTSPGTLVRQEGDGPSNIRDADLAYTYLGDTYDFYKQVHDRDGIDNKGITMGATVRYCEPGQGCPWQNAGYMTRVPEGTILPFGMLGDHMYFGAGFASAADVTGHELTHGVTSYESQLIYSYQSGALNESLSDMWGEWIELLISKPDQPAALRWLMGEDTPLGAIRSMKDPTLFGDPDRLGSPLYYTGAADNGGVHFNSGVTNKLCYLLTDGDEFNGHSVTGMGIEKAAKLMYELQTNLLTSSSDFKDFYMQLGQGTMNLGYTFEERLNVREAAQAVEIAPTTGEEQIRGFRAIPTYDSSGRPVIALMWGNPTSVNFRRVVLVRDTKKFPMTPSEGMEIYRGAAEKKLDIAVVAGTKYYYTLFADIAGGFPDQRTTSATAGGEPPDFQTEAFDSALTTGVSARNAFDLAFSQILFTPIGAALAPLGESQPASDYSHYAATLKKNVSELPVPRVDDKGAAFDVVLSENGVISITTQAPFEFFGKPYDKLYLASNGYIAFTGVKAGNPENTAPSLATHFAIPRISFLFTNLSPASGGNAWMRRLDDRVVITFENIPQFEPFVFPAANNPNTVQVELFYSGHIRITYMNVTAVTAVCGLSDGQGAALDPATLFPGVRSVPIRTNLSDLPSALSVASLEPVAWQHVDAGELIAFTVRSSAPVGAHGSPVLEAAWDGPGDVPFADNRDGTGTFRWQTTLNDMGTYTLRITATLGTQVAYQDVFLAVGVARPLPTASNLRLRTSNPVEDAGKDRPVSVDSQLTAEYNYSHPLEFTDPEHNAEGATQILWFRNNVLMSAFNNLKTVPPVALKPDDQWFFTVTPWTLEGVEGMPRLSPVVTTLPMPVIMNVALPDDLPPTIMPGDLPLTNLPKAVGPSGGGTTVVLLGKRLANAGSVTFGGIEALSVKTVSDNRLEAVTPAHVPSAVISGSPIAEEVRVTNPYGEGVSREAFTFMGDGSKLTKADVNHDGVVNAVDVQLVIGAILKMSKSTVDADVNRDGKINALDLQVVINTASGK